MDPLASLLSGTIAIYVLGAFWFALAYLRRPTDAEFGVAAVLSVALAEYSVGSLVTTTSPTMAGVLVGEKLRWVGLLAAFGMLVHFALRYRGVPHAKRIAAAIYGIATVLAILDARGMFHDAAHAGERHLFLRGVDLLYRSAPLTPVGIGAYALGCVAVATTLVLVARAYLAGKREALGIVVGTTVLLATVINDVGVAVGALSTAYVVNAGFVAFTFSIASSYTARYVAMGHELERRTRELRSRTRELRRSYEELRAAQEELVRKEQLAVVGELAAVIAHEVRNPLAIIGNAVSGLRKSTISKDDQETLLTILEEETSRLNRLVTDLLRYARPVNVQRTHLALNELLERSMGLIKNRKSLGVDFKMDMPDGHLWGDGNLLRQVFDNLIDNAVQAMGHAGTLTVRMRPMTDEGVDGIAVDIIDTGEGMDTQVRSRARDPFFTTRPSGTGLGLAIVDRIVDAHGGRFLIESRAGEGTTVTVFLPFGSSNEPPMRARARSRPTSDRPPPRPVPPE